MKRYAKTQTELADALTKRMGVSITARTVKRHAARGRQPLDGKPPPPRPRPDGRHDIDAWEDYLIAVDYRRIDTDSAVANVPGQVRTPPPATAPAQGERLRDYVVAALRPGLSDDERHERTGDALSWIILRLCTIQLPPAKSPTTTTSRNGSGDMQTEAAPITPEEDRAMQRQFDRQIYSILAEFDKYDGADREQELENLIFVSAAESLVLPDGRTFAEAAAELE